MCSDVRCLKCVMSFLVFLWLELFCCLELFFVSFVVGLCVVCGFGCDVCCVGCL